MPPSAWTFSVLVIGLAHGLRHATEADHLAAVATLVVRRATWPEAARLGICWGIGHTLTLAIIGGALLSLGHAVPPAVAAALELIVGVMLLVLGGDCLRSLFRKPVSSHSHLVSEPLDPGHLRLDPRGGRAIVVGMVHGTAGSSALVLLAINATGSAMAGFSYVVLFGLGSIIGMALLSLAMGVGVRLCARRATWLQRAVTTAAALFSCALGSGVIYQIGFVDGLLQRG